MSAGGPGGPGNSSSRVIPPIIARLIQIAWNDLQAGIPYSVYTASISDVEWRVSCSEGVIFIRRADMAKGKEVTYKPKED
jgi:hypothetical protein